jgi:hypothetical protein
MSGWVSSRARTNCCEKADTHHEERVGFVVFANAATLPGGTELGSEKAAPF